MHEQLTDWGNRQAQAVVLPLALRVNSGRWKTTCPESNPLSLGTGLLMHD